MILKAATDGAITLYTVPEQEAETGFVAFRVSPEGKVWLLTEQRGGKKPAVFEFNKDPNIPSRTSLDAPEGLRATNFVVLNNGYILLDGYFGDQAPEKVRGKSDLLEFDASGRLLRQSLNALTEEIKDISARAPDGASAEAEDGTIYLLRSDRVLVLNQAGMVQKRLRLITPEPGFRPSNIAVAAGQVLVYFRKSAGPGQPLLFRYVLLDATTGAQVRVYQPSEETGNNAVCFSNEGLTFMNIKNGRRVLVTASVR